MKEFIVKENEGFRLRVKSWKCKNPSNVNAIEFIQESKDKEGKIDMASTYQFFMTDEEIQTLTKGLLS